METNLKILHESDQAGDSQAHAVLQNALSAPTVGVLFFSLDGRIKDANETFAFMSGYTREELLTGVDLRMLTAPEFFEATARTAEDLGTTGKTPPYEKQMIRKDGSRWWGLFAPMRLSGNGSQSECMEFIVDITDRKLAEERFRSTEQQALLAVDTAGLGTYERDLATNEITMNTACRLILGVAQTRPPPDIAYQSLHPEDTERILAVVAAAFDPTRREVCSGEFRVVRPDGSVRWVAGRGRVLFDDSVHPAQPLKFIGVLFDITDRKSREQTLSEEAHLARFRADFMQALQHPAPINVLLQEAAALLVERLDAAFARIWTVDPSGQTLQLKASAGMYTHLDGPHSRVPVGRYKIGLIACQRQPLFTNQVVGDPNVPEQDWARREGLVAFAGFPLLLEEKLLGVVALFARHPLSQAAIETFGTLAATLAQTLGRLQAQQELQKAKEDLARINQKLEQKVHTRTAKLEETVAELEHFSYTITHDMRAPLRAMRGFADMLLAEFFDLPRDHRDLVRRISEAARRMDLLITDALHYSQVIRDRIPLKNVDPLPILRGIIESYPQFHPPHARITIDPGIPRVLANEAALNQVFSNLLGNAVKFMEQGVMPQIRIWAETPPPVPDHAPYARICVQDNGIGIAPEYQDKIWEMFQRLSTQYEGTGIGLALVRKIVQRMRGRVGVQSQPGQGSLFWVELRFASEHR